MHTRIVALALLTLATTTFAQAQSVPPETTKAEVGVFFWKPTPEITVDDVDFVGDLGIAEERFKEYRVTLKPGRSHRIRFAYVPFEYEEQGATLRRQIRFQGVTYNVNVPVNAALKWELYRFGYEWDFVSGSRAAVGVIGEVKYNKVAATLASPSRTESVAVKAPVPTIGAVARVYPSEYVSVTAEFTGLKLDRTVANGYRGKFYDLDVFARLHLNKNLAAQAGYRSITVDYLVDGDSGTLKLTGPYFGGVLGF